MVLRFPRSYTYRWTYLLVNWKLILILLAILHTLLSIYERKHPFTTHAHTITPSSISFISSHLSTPSASLSLSPESASSFCRAHRFAPLTPSVSHPHSKSLSTTSRKRKVYDLLLFSSELDFLEIRLETLYDVVDYFIIVESPVTFTLKPKPLHLRENWARFKKWEDKIIHHVLEIDSDPKKWARTWDVEDFQRNGLMVPTFWKLNKGDFGPGKGIEKGDVLVVSDVDEIPRPATMMILRNCEVGRRVTIRSLFYYYGFQWRHRGEEWAHGQATVYEGVNTILPTDLRNGEGGGWNWFWIRRWWETSEIWNAGWHCSTCFEKVEDVLGKMGSFSHTSLNQQGFRDRERIIDRVRNGKDLWDRKGEEFDRIDDNEDIPEVLKGDRKRWGYLLDRDGENAGFIDYKDEGKG